MFQRQQQHPALRRVTGTNKTISEKRHAELTGICDNLIRKINEVKPKFLELVGAEYTNDILFVEHFFFPDNFFSIQKMEKIGNVYCKYNCLSELIKVTVYEDCMIDLTLFNCSEIVEFEIRNDLSLTIKKLDETKLHLCLRSEITDKFTKSVEDITFDRLIESYEFQTEIPLKVKEIHYINFNSSVCKDTLESVFNIRQKCVDRISNTLCKHLIKSVNSDELAEGKLTESIEDKCPQLKKLTVSATDQTIKLSDLPNINKYTVKIKNCKLLVDKELDQLKIWNFLDVTSANKLFDMITFEHFPSKKLCIKEYVFTFRDTRSNKVKSARFTKSTSL